MVLYTTSNSHSYRLHSTYSHRLSDYLSIILLFSGHIHVCLCCAQPLEFNIFLWCIYLKNGAHRMHTHVLKLRIFLYIASDCNSHRMSIFIPLKLWEKNVNKWEYFHSSKHLWKQPFVETSEDGGGSGKCAHNDAKWHIDKIAVYWCLLDSDV